MLLIFTATERWSGKANFTEYLGNAATMTSLLLGVVAIFYSFISNIGLSKNLGSIGTVSDEISKTKNEIKESVIKLESIAIISGETKTGLQELRDSFQLKLTELHETVNTVANHTKDLPSKLDEYLTEQKNKSSQTSSDTSGSTHPNWNKDAIDSLLENSLLSINLLLLAIISADEKKVFLDLKEYSKAIELDWSDFYGGVITTLTSTSVINSTVERFQVFKINYINPELKRRARSYLLDYLNNSADAGSKQRYLHRIELADKYFESLT